MIPKRKRDKSHVISGIEILRPEMVTEVRPAKEARKSQGLGTDLRSEAPKGIK